MYVSQAASKDLNMPFPMGPFKQGKDEAAVNHHHNHQQQMPTGLLRYRTAPSALLGEMCEDLLPHRSSSPETDSMLARFMSPEIREHMEEKPSAAPTEQRNSQYMTTIDHEALEAFQQPSGGFPSSTSQLYHAQQPPQIPPRHSSSAATAAESSYRVVSSMGMDDEQGKRGANNSNLIRHSSSPAGLFSHLNAENGKSPLLD